MAELLIRIADKSDNPLAFKAGHIIAVKEDGWGWSSLELEHPDYRLLRIPLTGMETDALLMSAQSKTVPGKVVATRANAINTSNIKALDDSVKAPKDKNEVISLRRADIINALITI